MFGYFPTYTIGSLYAAQLTETYAKANHLDDEIRAARFGGLLEWLGANVYKTRQPVFGRRDRDPRNWARAGYGGVLPPCGIAGTRLEHDLKNDRLREGRLNFVAQKRRNPIGRHQNNLNASLF